MSKLEFFARPLVAFDPADKQHRRWYYEFLEYGGWGTCPVRFICPDNTGYDLTIMIRNQLIEYYVGKEFSKRELVGATRKVAQKRKKTVDKQPKR
jgi:hypothetical protein